ncbi:hypothetical protein DEJ23_11855 [Curtobacterium sp. MCSS17_008]|uniref:anti-sigma factor n=1 Tax=Curtobacterium sp. MCSS17_008 TaxID=2175647 RepID=UPI000DA8E3F8|nr:anti-sigma factor [Curtobacterium sp. MCSS17_008]PZF55370.1 hypothetical protein DEJ23_11855 [Curtobacterium sp. MCSS17_008]
MTERHDDPALLTGSHALDALSDDERALLEHVLTTSPELQAETDSLRETALQLAYAVEPIEPPAALKSSLMAQIARTPQAAPDEQVAAVPAAVTGLEAPLAPATTPAPVTSPAPVEGRAAATARRRWFQRPAAALSAAAAVAVVFLGVGLGVGTNFGQSEGTGPETTQASGSLDSIYAASDFQRTTAEVPGGGSATVVWSHDVGKSAVILDGVEQAPEGKTYELWYIGSEGTKVVPAGLVDGARGGVHTAVLEGELTPGDSIGMTVEPEGGSDQPTTTPLMAVPTTQA